MRGAAAAQRETRIAVLDDPRALGSALTGELGGLWRWRIGDYRVVARIEDERITILVVRVAHRAGGASVSDAFSRFVVCGSRATNPAIRRKKHLSSCFMQKIAQYFPDSATGWWAMLDKLKVIIGDCLSRDLILDLYDAVSARALAAHEMIRDHADLDEKRARMCVGRVRFPMQERSFEDVCTRHAGARLDCDVMPGTNLKFFQPFYRFADGTRGIILGFASMPEKGRLPAENMSRKAGVAINFDLVPRLDFDGTGPKAGDIYVLFLVARDPMRPGQVAEVAIGVIDAEYESYLFYETVEGFFASYTGRVDPEPTPDKDPPLVTLKASATPFKPKEQTPTDESGSEPAAS